MNKVILIGNLTRDPEISTTVSGLSLCKMSIAVNRNFANANGEREPDFFNIIAWRNLADNCARYLTKGRKIAVDGRLQTRTYDDKDGNKRYVTEVVADEIEFISPGGSQDGGTPTQPAKKKMSELEPVDNDDLPF